MAVYGDTLCFFTEQFRTANYFSLQPHTTSGHGERTDLGTVRGVFQYVKRNELYRDNNTLSDVKVPVFWTRKKLKVGNYLTLKGEEDEILRIKGDNSWKHEGNFYAYELESDTGNTDRQEEFEEVDLGGGFA